jgi:hypothetical protein
MAFLPTDLAGLAIWLKADSLNLLDGSGVSVWTDSGPSGYTVPFTVALGNRPTYKSNIINRLPVVRFDSSNNQALFCSGNIGTANLTSFTVLNSSQKSKAALIANSAKGSFATVANYETYVGDTPGSGWSFSAQKNPNTGQIFVTNNAAAMYLGDWVIRTDVADDVGGNYTQRRNSSTIYSTTFAAGNIAANIAAGNSFSVGATRYNGAPSNFYSGDIAEVILYNRALSTSEQVQVENYLKFKYFITALGCPLFMLGAQAPTGVFYATTPLVALGGTPVATNSVPLYTNSADFLSGNIPLYISSANFLSGLAPLYVAGKGSSSGSTTLYTAAANFLSGSVPLYIGSSNFLSGLKTLFMSGSVGLSNKNLSLFTYAAPNSGLYATTSLYTTCFPTSGTASIPLYTGSAVGLSGNVKLYIGSALSMSGSIPIYTLASTSFHKSMPLYVSQTTVNKTNNIPLFVAVNQFSSAPGTNGMYKTMPLYMLSNINKGMPLYVKTDPFGITNKSLPLYVGVRESLWNPINNNIPLLIQNNTQSVNSRMVKLTVKGLGTLKGGLPFSQSMPLYIERAFNNGISLFIKSNTATSNAPLYTFGTNRIQSGVNLTTYGGPYSGVKTLSLYASGPSSISSSGIPLYVKGLPNVTANKTLYVNGF